MLSDASNVGLNSLSIEMPTAIYAREARGTALAAVGCNLGLQQLKRK